jgi:hypothetical protein
MECQWTARHRPPGWRRGAGWLRTEADPGRVKMAAPQTLAIVAVALAVAGADGGGEGATTVAIHGALEAKVPVQVVCRDAVSSTMFVIQPLGSVAIRPIGSFFPPDGGYPKRLSPSVSFAVEIPGTSLRTGTITHANSRYAHGSVEATSAQADGEWMQHFSARDPSSEKGTFALTVSSVGSIAAIDAGTRCSDAHGRLSATLPASMYTPDAGTVRVEVIF